MIPFSLALENHAAVDMAACEDVNAAQQLWECLVSGANTDPRQEALSETVPEEYVALVRQDVVAAAYAFARLWSAYTSGKTGYDLRQMFRNGWGAFDQQAKTADDLAEGFGWDRSDAWQNYREIVGTNIDTAQATRIARLAGRMYAVIRGGAKRTVKGIPAEVCDVTRGNDLSRLVGAEFAMLAAGDDTLEMVEYLRLATHAATIFETQGDEETSKGPLVFMRDESGSMHGHRHEWAAAAMIAMSRVAAEEHRQVAVVHFSTSVVVQELDAGNPAQIYKLITSHMSGGTDIARALRAGTKKVLEWKNKSGALADAVLISDGLDEGEDIPAAVDEMVGECRLWTVGIDCDVPEDNPLRSKAHEYVHLSEKDLKAETVLTIAKAAL